jgi:hypothetical protein
MGPPKMSYPREALNKLSDLKERLGQEIEGLLEKYFPGTSVVYR